MYSGGGETKEVKEELGTYVKNLGKGRGKYKGVGIFFKAVVQVLLIFGTKTWVMTPHMGRDLGGFQHKVAQQITGRKTRRLLDRSWEYPPMKMAIQEEGFEEMKAYVLKRQNTVVQYIAMRPILDLCKETL